MPRTIKYPKEEFIISELNSFDKDQIKKCGQNQKQLPM